jgi:hypothetical protein
VTVTDQLRGPNGATFARTPHTSIVSAAPILLRGGRVAIDAFREGVFDPRDLNNYGFSAERHGRTFAGSTGGAGSSWPPPTASPASARGSP